ncbi:transposase, partial [Intrasporangium chromatireducens Q5-1]
VSADGADWIAKVVTDRCPAAVRCADPFHVVAWATDALDQVRRDAWNTARGAVDKRRAGRASGHAKALKGARYALWKNPDTLTGRQQAKLAWIARTDPRLYRAYLLKEGLRLIFRLPYEEAVEALERWISWARRCRIEAFVDLQRRIVKHRDSILAAIQHGLSNGRIESVNTKVRLITRIAFGFRSPEALIALAMLSLGGHRPSLPGRK